MYCRPTISSRVARSADDTLDLSACHFSRQRIHQNCFRFRDTVFLKFSKSVTMVTKIKKRQFVFQLRVISFTHILQASHILKSSVFSTLVAFLLKSDGPRHFGEF